MKLSKQILKEAIRDAMDEAVSAQELTKSAKSKEAQKEMGALTPRERNILQTLQQVQKAMSGKGEQATPKVTRLVQLMVGELQKGAE